jgi:hypothetical protein
MGVRPFFVSGGEMALPILDSHPRGWQNPVNLRVSAALPAAGAWDATPVESFSSGAHNLTLSFTYTRGAAGGAFDWQLEVSIYAVAALVPAGASEWVTESLYAAGGAVAGVDSQSRVQREFQTYQATGAAAEDFVFGPIALNGTIERFRVTARESGVVGTPGDLQIAAELF